MTIIVPPKGPFPTELAIVGEAPGRDEELYRQCFIGASGSELSRMLVEAGIHPASVYFTNVFKIRPEKNDVEKFFTTKKLGDPNLPPLRAGRYLPTSALFWLELLRTELEIVRPRLILALGNTALWALTGTSGIAKLRGVIHKSAYGPVIGTYHPAAILRVWSLRSIAIADFIKSKQYLEGELSAPTDSAELYLDPVVEDFPKFHRLVESAETLGVDIETARGQITMVGIAVSPDCGFCIPFWDPETCRNYWDTEEEEVQAWKLVQWVLKQKRRKVLHNGLYDIQYLCQVANDIPMLEDDTILLHHALQPEMKKDLGTLGATYLNRSAWKQLRHRRGDDIVKKDE